MLELSSFQVSDLAHGPAGRGPDEPVPRARRLARLRGRLPAREAAAVRAARASGPAPTVRAIPRSRPPSRPGARRVLFGVAATAGTSRRRRRQRRRTATAIARRCAARSVGATTPRTSARRWPRSTRAGLPRPRLPEALAGVRGPAPPARDDPRGRRRRVGRRQHRDEPRRDDRRAAGLRRSAGRPDRRWLRAGSGPLRARPRPRRLARARARLPPGHRRAARGGGDRCRPRRRRRSPTPPTSPRRSAVAREARARRARRCCSRRRRRATTPTTTSSSGASTSRRSSAPAGTAGRRATDPPAERPPTRRRPLLRIGRPDGPSPPTRRSARVVPRDGGARARALARDRRVRASRSGGARAPSRWGFYEGPPTANGAPGSHHVLARVFKDIFPRYKTMCGYQVVRKGGWDCHGLPVELAVEEELGFTSKDDIEALRDRRVQRALPREGPQPRRGLEGAVRADRPLDRPRRLLPHARPDYVESVWWALRTIHDKGLLFEKLKVVPYCTRCGTALSSHELGQPGVYQDDIDLSAYVRLPVRTPVGPLRGGRRARRLDDDPVDARLKRRRRGRPGDDVCPRAAGRRCRPRRLGARRRDGPRRREGAARARARADGGGARRVSRAGDRRRRATSRRSRSSRRDEYGPSGHTVLPADFVTDEEGTGLVHTAIAFGEDDFRLGEQFGIAAVNPVRARRHLRRADRPVRGPLGQGRRR